MWQSNTVSGSTICPDEAFSQAANRSFASRFAVLNAAELKRSLPGDDGRGMPFADLHIPDLAQPTRPWLAAFRTASSAENRAETARVMRPLMASAVAEHEVLVVESGAARYLRRTGLLTLYRSRAARSDLARELALAAELGVATKTYDAQGAAELEPDLAPVFHTAVHWPAVASLSDPLAVTRACTA